jgi:prepilin peptidase CpaA
MVHFDKEFIFPAVATSCAIVAAFVDIRSRKIPNIITGPALLIGLLLHLAIDGWSGLLTALTAGLVCGLLFLAFYLAGGMGAGDVKLMAAVGCIAGLPNSASLLIWTALAGGVMALFIILIRGRIKQTLRNIGSLMTHHAHEGLTPHPDLNLGNQDTLRLPYGLAIALGGTITLYLRIGQR